MDHCFPDDEDGQKLTILVVVERHSKMKKAVVFTVEGFDGKKCSGNGDGRSDDHCESDQEPAIKFLVDDLSMGSTGARIIVEQALAGSVGFERCCRECGPVNRAVLEDF